MSKTKWEPPLEAHPEIVSQYRVIRGGTQQFRFLNDSILRFNPRTQRVVWEGKGPHPKEAENPQPLESVFGVMQAFFEKEPPRTRIPRLQPTVGSRPQNPPAKEPPKEPPWQEPLGSHRGVVWGFRVWPTTGREEYILESHPPFPLQGIILNPDRPNEIVWSGAYLPEDAPRVGTLGDALGYVREKIDALREAEAEVRALRERIEKEREDVFEKHLERERAAQIQLQEARAAYRTNGWPAWLDENPWPTEAESYARAYRHVSRTPPWPKGLQRPETFGWRLVVRPDRAYFLPPSHPIKGHRDLYVVVPRLHSVIGGPTLREYEPPTDPPMKGKWSDPLPTYFHEDSYLFVIPDGALYALRGIRGRTETRLTLTRRDLLAPVLEYGGPVEWRGFLERTSETQSLTIPNGPDQESEPVGRPYDYLL